MKSSNRTDTILSTIANILTILTSTEFIKERIYDPQPLWGKIILLIVWICLLVASFFWLVRSLIRWFFEKKCTKFGTRGIPCSVEYYYNFKVYNRSKGILLRMHKFTYHDTYNIRREIAQNNYKDKKDVSGKVKKLVSDFQHSLNIIFNLDVTIGVKLVASVGKQKVLQTYLLVPSQSEMERDNRKVLDVYLLKKSNSEDMVDYVKEIKNSSINKNYPQNSAFNYVLCSSKNYWMSNDLTVDEEKGEFITTSCNYKRFYKSMAVFAICPPRPDGENNVPMRGVLTFDTPKTGTFSEMECKFIMGYFAHCLYEIFKDLK